MIKAIIFSVIGAAAMYLFLNPNDFVGLQDTARDAANQVGQFIVEKTQK